MDLFNLVARIVLDSSEYKKQLGDARKETHSFGDKVKSGLKSVATIAMSGISAAAGAVISISKKSLEAYADYEQLVGGVETLFKDNADIVKEYAANAYKTAGMSANDYMKTVTGFSASLLQSLDGDTKKAADYADMAISDMADNANKMGTSIESIQNAYQGFAKGQYQLLDNLKLGYGGTKTEMERLLTDAEKLDASFKATRDENGKLSMSYSDVVDAIHIVQNEMGITGTTAKEASTTISGSLDSTKAVWHNLLVGLADDNADIGLLVDKLVENIVTTGNNLIPRVKKILEGIIKLISTSSDELVPTIIDALLDALPDLISAAFELAVAIAKALLTYDWWGLAKKIFASLKESFKRLFKGDEEEPDTSPKSQGQPHGRHASGLKYVPFDEYHAVLHRGERVLTAKEAQEYEYSQPKPTTFVQTTDSSESVRVMRMMLEEMRTMHNDMFQIILAALRTNSDDFSVSEKDMIRMAKKYAFA